MNMKISELGSWKKRFRRSGAAIGLAVALMSGEAAAGTDVVLDWNEIMVATLAGQNPFVESRIAAITHLAVFEAVNAVTGRYRPYLGTISAPEGASAEAAAIAAAHAVLVHYVPGKAIDLDTARAASLAAIPDGQPKEDGIAVGAEAAAALIAEREGDGSETPKFHLPASSEPGVWQLTPSCSPLGGVFLHVRDVTPFGIRSGDQFRIGPPPPLKSFKYARNYIELTKLGDADSTNRPPDRADVARFYAVVLGVATWNPAVRQVAAAQDRSLTDNARAFALLNMAIADGLIAVMDTKYHYTFWRPETAIRAGDTDGNRLTRPDPDYEPFVPTPCHPSYPSAHATLGHAARKVAERIFGPDGHSITLSSPAVPGVELHYTRFEDITSDIDDARIYGGIHYRFDQEEGGRLGRRVGAYIYWHNLRPNRGRGLELEEQEFETEAMTERSGKTR
jgi:hypothetical protein